MDNISIKDIELITKTKVYTYDVPFNPEDGIKNTIKLQIVEDMDYGTLNTIADKIANNVVSNGIYSPENKKIMYLFYVLYNMTNCKPQIDDEGNLNSNEMFKFLKSPIGKKIEELEYEIPTLCELNQLIEDKIEFKKNELLQKSSLDEAFDTLNTLLLTLNEKAKKVDTKKIEKIIKNLNPQEIMKAYKNSGIGNDVRDKAIQEQAQEIKNLKNQISARNVINYPVSTNNATDKVGE